MLVSRDTFAPPGPHTACCCWRVCCLWLPLRRRLRALLLRLHAVRLRPGCECHHGCGSDATSIAAAAVAFASGAAAVASIAAAAALSAAALHSYCVTTAAATAAAAALYPPPNSKIIIILTLTCKLVHIRSVEVFFGNLTYKLVHMRSVEVLFWQFFKDTKRRQKVAQDLWLNDFGNLLVMQSQRTSSFGNEQVLLAISKS